MKRRNNIIDYAAILLSIIALLVTFVLIPIISTNDEELTPDSQYMKPTDFYLMDEYGSLYSINLETGEAVKISGTDNGRILPVDSIYEPAIPSYPQPLKKQ